MRTLAETVSTRQEAEHIGSRLRDLGIPPDRIALKEVSQSLDAGPGDGAGSAQDGILVTVKVLPEQLSAATKILKSLDKGVGETPPSADTHQMRSNGAADRTKPASPDPAPVRERSTPPIVGRSAPPSAERTEATAERSSRSPAREDPLDWRALVRIAAMAVLITAVGIALGAFLGILL